MKEATVIAVIKSKGVRTTGRTAWNITVFDEVTQIK